MPDSLWTLAFWIAGFCAHMAVIVCMARVAGVLFIRSIAGRGQ